MVGVSAGRGVGELIVVTGGAVGRAAAGTLSGGGMMAEQAASSQLTSTAPANRLLNDVKRVNCVFIDYCKSTQTGQVSNLLLWTK